LPFFSSFCSRKEQPALGHVFLSASGQRSAPSLLWALAELRAEDPEVIQAACREAVQALGGTIS
jgi:hypothetical protein